MRNFQSLFGAIDHFSHNIDSIIFLLNYSARDAYSHSDRVLRSGHLHSCYDLTKFIDYEQRIGIFGVAEDEGDGGPVITDGDIRLANVGRDALPKTLHQAFESALSR